MPPDNQRSTFAVRQYCGEVTKAPRAMSELQIPREDPTQEDRKKDHIELAFRSRVDRADPRFDYEPLLAAHPAPGSLPAVHLLGKAFRTPLWVSSMTGGTALARTINHNLARACAEFGMGMGLGSCRPLLYDDEFFEDFNVRPITGDDVPLFANLGIAQLEKLLRDREMYRVDAMVDKLRADGLIVHVNPLQEALQPEGDAFTRSPLATIEALLEQTNVPLIVKEVGQGMGPASLRALLQLPLLAIDFAASGGTNFALLELLRQQEAYKDAYTPLAGVGHSAAQMVEFVNDAVTELGDRLRCRQLIISGGVRDFLDGYYLTQRLNLPSVYGQASAFLQYARGDYADLRAHVERQVRGLELAHAYLKVRS